MRVPPTTPNEGVVCVLERRGAVGCGAEWGPRRIERGIARGRSTVKGLAGSATGRLEKDDDEEPVGLIDDEEPVGLMDDDEEPVGLMKSLTRPVAGRGEGEVDRLKGVLLGALGVGGGISSEGSA